MTITLFIEPKAFTSFVRVTEVLKDLDFENDYVFTPSDLIFSEAMISNWIWVNMDVKDYLKLKYCIGKLTSKNSKD